MGKGRLEAFSDGVIAIIITIMVLELKAPAAEHGETYAALRPLVPAFLSYILSFVYIGIYWTNHHHLLHAVKHVSGMTLWANLHLLFWISLIPFVTSWIGESHFAPRPVAAYGAVLLMCALAWQLLLAALLKRHGRGSTLAAAIGREHKEWGSVSLYGIGIALALAGVWLESGGGHRPAVHWTGIAGCVVYGIVAAMWFVPDRRIERAMAQDGP
jgi:uncharacterized membrane protein